jgi:lysozyme
MSFLSSLLKIFTSFTINILDGFQYLPVTKINQGSIFSQMLNAVNYVDQTGKFFLGQPFSSTSSLSSPSFTPAPTYTPGGTTPPVSFPTAQQNGYVVPMGTNPVNMYHLSSEGLRHLKYFEGLHQRPYVINNQKYIGYGHMLSSSDTTTYVSQDQADSFLAADVLAAEGTVKSAIMVKVSQGQFDALVDFAYTVSTSAFKSSDVVSSINGGDVAGACTNLMNWCYGMQNGIVAQFAHLIARRTFNVHWVTRPVDVQPPV